MAALPFSSESLANEGFGLVSIEMWMHLLQDGIEVGDIMRAFKKMGHFFTWLNVILKSSCVYILWL